MPRTAQIYRPQHLARQVHLAGVPLASFRRRAAAFALDAAVLTLLVLAVVLPLPGGVRLPASDELQVSIQLSSVAVAVGAVLYFGVTTWIGRGRTPGKRLLGIRVVSLVHERLSLWHCIERALGYFASSLEGGFGFVQYFTHVNAQTVHDRIAETIVVREVGAGVDASASFRNSLELAQHAERPPAPILRCGLDGQGRRQHRRR